MIKKNLIYDCVTLHIALHNTSLTGIFRQSMQLCKKLRIFSHSHYYDINSFT